MDKIYYAKAYDRLVTPPYPDLVGTVINTLIVSVSIDMIKIIKNIEHQRLIYFRFLMLCLFGCSYW